MRRRKLLKTGVITAVIISNLLMISGCGTDENNKSINSSSGSESVNSIKETKIENYEVNVKSIYIHHASGLGMGVQFEVKFKDITPACDVYVYNEMSSLYDIKSAEENDKKIEENPEAYEAMLNGDEDAFDYKHVFYTNLSYAAGEQINIDWTPHPTEDNFSKFSSEEEYLKTGYIYIVLKDGENITGFMVLEIPVGTTRENSTITYTDVNVLEAVSFEKTDGKYQNISLDYVKTRVKNVISLNVAK